MDWIGTNWQWIMVAFYVLEKIVKVSPAKWDDILLDGIKSIFEKLFGRTPA